MFNFNIIETQISKRLQVFFTHQATESNIDAAKMQLIIRSENRQVTALLYEKGVYIKQLELRLIAESFGKEFDHAKVREVHEYLIKTAKAADIALSALNIVICPSGGKIGAYVYDGTKCLYKVNSIELLTLFYYSK